MAGVPFCTRRVGCAVDRLRLSRGFSASVFATVQSRAPDRCIVEPAPQQGSTMFVFRVVKDMHSSESAVAIVKAVKAIDDRAYVFIDTERFGVPKSRRLRPARHS
jgi:hypothetical protein